jgi:hypothetical protein
MHWKTWTAGLGIVGLVLACGDDGGGDGPGMVGGNLLVNLDFPDVIEFGAVPVGLRVTESLEISNRGTQPIEVERLEAVSGFEEAGYRFELGDTGPFDVPLGNPTPVEIGFEATGEVSGAEAVARLVLANGESAEITLTARTDQALLVEPTEFEFGETTVGWPAEGTLTIRNLLARPVPVFVQTRDGSASATQIQGVGRFDIDTAVSQNRLSGGNPLGAGQEIELRVVYSADAQGAARDVAEWDLGPCPDFELCGTTVTFRGTPVADEITCSSDGMPIGGRPDEMEPPGFEIGNLNPPETFEQTITCEVRENLRIDNIVGPPRTASGIRIDADDVAGTEVEGGSSFAFTVRFDPSTVPPGTRTDDEIEIQVRDPRGNAERPPVLIPVGAGHGRPELSAEPASLDFQSVRLFSTRPDTLVVTNSGPVEFRGELSLEPASDEFSAADEGRETTIPAGATVALDLEFTPETPGTYETTAVLQSNTDRDPNARLEVALTGEGVNLLTCELEQSATELSFGRSAPDVDNRAFLVLRNTRSNDCILNGFRFAPDSSSEIELVSPQIREQVLLGGNEALVVEMRYRPTENGPSSASAELEFYSSADPAARAVDIEGSRSLTPLFVGPNVLDFRGSLSSCSTYGQRIEVFNGSSASVGVTDIEIVGADRSSFSLDPELNLPFNVSPRPDAGAFEVRFEPDGSNEVRAAALEITLSDAMEPYVVPLVAEARPVNRAVERFTQAPSNAVDVIVAVPDRQDVTAADRDVEALLDLIAANWEAFGGSLGDAGLDYRIGFITGVQDPFCFGSQLPADPTDALNHDGSCGYLSLGARGVFAERWKTIEPQEMGGEEFVWELQVDRAPPFPPSFTRPLFNMYLSAHPDVRDWNDEVFREDATVHWLVLDNQDAFANSEGAEEIARFLRYVRGSANRNRQGMSLIVGPPDQDCVNQTTIRNAGAAPNYYAAAGVLGGGPRQSVCQADLGLVLEAAAEGARGVRRFHPLPREPQMGSVDVRVDGMALGADDFAVDGRSVELADPSARAAGAEIEIEYTPVCDGS